MVNANEALISLFCHWLRRGYRRMYGHLKRPYEEIICWVGRMALEYIANSDALYHNAEHTFLVTLVGQEILRGKHMREGAVTPEDWLHFLVSLACHDIGYVKGVCRQDRREESLFAAGRNGAMIALPPGSSDASLTPYHVDRGKLFVEERFRGHALLDAEVIKRNIELTRFPVPAAEDPRDTAGYPGLVRAADLLGQLSDPRYLRKTAALFYEFEETGTNKILGYKDPGDLRKNYPKFYWQAVSPYIRDALGYLGLTQEGKQVVANLNSHVFVVEHERLGEDWTGKLTDRDRFVRMQAAAALGQMGPQARKAVPALIERLADEDESVRQWAARALGQIGSATAVQPLHRALGDDNAFVRIKAAEALWELKDREGGVIPALVAVLGQSNWLAVREAAFTLGQIGPRAKAAVPALVKAVCQPTSEAHKAAVEALRKIDPTAVVDALVGALHCDDRDICAEAADGLGELGPAAGPAVPALVEALNNDWWIVRRAAAEALGKIGPEARNAVLPLTVELQDDHAPVRQAAAEALGRIGPDASEAQSALEEAVKDRDDDVSRAASEALRKVRVARRVGA